jgi:hypothetical protein
MEVVSATFYCWWCGKTLCLTCGDEIGHCGHPEADEVNERSGEMDGDGWRRVAEALRIFRGNAEHVAGVRSTLRPKPN